MSKALSSVHLQAIRDAFAAVRTDATSGLQDETLLLLTRAPLWANCKHDSKVLLYCLDWVNHRFPFLIKSYSHNLAMQLCEAFQMMHDTDDPEYWCRNKLKSAIAAFFRKVRPIVTRDWVNDVFVQEKESFTKLWQRTVLAVENN